MSYQDKEKPKVCLFTGQVRALISTLVQKWIKCHLCPAGGDEQPAERFVAVWLDEGNVRRELGLGFCLFNGTLVLTHTKAMRKKRNTLLFLLFCFLPSFPFFGRKKSGLKGERSAAYLHALNRKTKGGVTGTVWRSRCLEAWQGNYSKASGFCT